MHSKIIYIAGYGRSGSTILEIFLSKTLEIFPTGELTNLFECYTDNNFCECGKLIKECPFWREIIENSVSKTDMYYYDKLTKRAESFAIGRLFEKDWKALWGKITKSIFASSNHQAILDSSKSTRKNFYRSRYLDEIGYELNKILMIRNPEDVMKSAKKGSNKLLEKGSKNAVKPGGAFRAGISWLLTNYFVFNRLNPKKDIIITYDSFVKEPEKIASAIKSKFGLNYRSKDEQKHGISGNRLRRTAKEDFTIKRKKSDVNLNGRETFLANYLMAYYKRIIQNDEFTCL